MLRNRRNSERQLVENQRCQIQLNSVVADGVMMDISVDGAKLGGIRVAMLFVDQRVEVMTADETFAARCRTCTRGTDGLFQIGVLKVADDFQRASESLLVNSFVLINDQKHVCLPYAVNEQGIHVQLLDGQQHVVPVDTVCQMTRQERLEELCDDAHLSQAIARYGYPTKGNAFEDRSKVLNHEFGPPNQPFYVSNQLANASAQ